MAYLPAYRLKLYRNFKAIDSTDYHGIVRYYERFEDAIGTLDMEEYFDCTLAYTEALFAIGNYAQHIVMCDHLLELVIMQNIRTWGGEDVYARLLFKKAAALYQLQEYPKSEHILRELIKLHPRDRVPVRFLRACLLRQKPAWLSVTRSATILLLFLAVAVIALELFVVRPFFPDFYHTALLLHNVLLVGGIAVLAAGEFSHGWRCFHTARRFARNMCRRKKQN
ncbi:MAG: hypothetical protein EP344_13190 [Bacteroidetes bacterium]|nr:MAG: hypothetical protein EP344_13190 [Bacteroidota bacterium]